MPRQVISTLHNEMDMTYPTADSFSYPSPYCSCYTSDASNNRAPLLISDMTSRAPALTKGTQGESLSGEGMQDSFM